MKIKDITLNDKCIKEAIWDEEQEAYKKHNFDSQHICDCGCDEFFCVCGRWVTAIICTKCKKMEVVHDG